MTALPVNLVDLEARMRIISEQFDKSVDKSKKLEFITFNKPGRYVIRVLPSRNYPADVQWFRKLSRDSIKFEDTSGILFGCGYHNHDTPCPIYKAVKAAMDNILKEVAAGKFGKGSAKSSAKYIINVVTPDKQDIVQTAEVPQSFIKFLRTFQSMVNMLFCDPTHGNLIAFEVTPAANGFGNDYKMLKQQPMPSTFSGEQIPDLDELLKAAFGVNLAAPPAAMGPALGADFSIQAAPPAAPAAADDPFTAYVASIPAILAAQASASGEAVSRSAATPAASPARRISDADAADLQAKLLEMETREKVKEKVKKAGTLKPVRS
jgi:hypothetical protein